MTEKHIVQCDCGSVELTITGEPKVRAYCHCEDCRELLQVPYHSVLAWDSDQVDVTRGDQNIVEFKHPHKKMKRIFCKICGDVLYNTNSMDWKIVSQLMFIKSNNGKLPDHYVSNAHFFYDRRIIDIDDELPKR